jgi:PAS domain S-box-containing protein
VPVDGVTGQDWVDPGFLESVPDPVVVVDRQGVLVFVNEAARRLVGLRHDRPLGMPAAEVFVDAADREAFEEVLRRVLGGTAWQGPMAVVGSDGQPVDAEVSCSVMRRGDEVVGLVCLFTHLGDTHNRDHTARKLAKRLTALAKVAAELAVAEDLETVAEVVTFEAAQVVGATVGSLSLLVDPDTLELVGLHGGREGAAARWRRFSVHANTPAGDVARSGERLVLIGRDAIEARYPDLERAAEGERSMLLLPLRMTGRTTGVMSWSFPGQRRLDAAEMEFYTVLADSCAQAVERIRAQQASAEQEARVRFLADATSKLAESLDYQRTLAEVARMAVPAFADWCAIDLVDDARLRRLAVEHVDPEMVAMALEVERRFPAGPEEGGAWAVIRSGEPLLLPEVTDEMIAPAARSDEHLRLLLELQLRSVVMTPLIARGTVLGVMTWVMAESGRHYRQVDLDFATDLARRAAIAIDNSQLHTDTLEAATRLQAAVLPQLPGSVSGWEIASHYSPSGRTEVGGDFFDVVPLDGDRVVVFVGDVMGRGVRAAAAMAQMRSAVRAYVADDPTPHVVFAKLDRLFAFYDLDQLVTMVYLLAEGQSVQVMAAGHPPPVLLRQDSGDELVATDPGRPFGAEPVDRVATTFELADGDVIVAFTDGLIERRGEAIDVGERRLLEALTARRDCRLAELLAKVVADVQDISRDDDVAALALRRSSHHG